MDKSKRRKPGIICELFQDGNEYFGLRAFGQRCGRAAIVSSLHPASSADEALIERVRAMGARLGGEVFRRQSMLVRTGDLGRLHAIACPTLVVAAANDQLRGVDEAEEVRGGIAGATLAVIEDSGHMIPLEAPRRLAALMVDWLTQQNGKASH